MRRAAAIGLRQQWVPGRSPLHQHVLSTSICEIKHQFQSQNVSERRYINVFFDHSFLAKRLESQGIILKVSPPGPDDIADEKHLENPSQRIIDLADEVLSLDVVEMAQYSRTIEVAFFLPGVIGS